MEWNKDGFTVSDDRTRVDVGIVTELLGNTYWGHRRPPQIIGRLIEHSLCFSMFSKDTQIGFARVVTDYTVFSWLSDLVLAEDFRGKKLGGWLMECILNHPAIVGTQFVLQTGVAHHFYARFRFDLSDKLMTQTGTAT